MSEIKPIRVAQVIGKMCSGGVESVVFNYYQETDKSLVQFDFFYNFDSTVAPPQELINMGARFYEIPPFKKLWKYIATLKRYFKENDYKIVHSHLNTLSVFPLFIAKQVGVPVRIAHNHSVPGGDEIIRNAIKRLLKNFSRSYSTVYFACSEKAGRWMFGDHIFEQGEVVIVNNAISFQRFIVKANQRNQLKEKYHIENKVVIGHVGRFTYAKNHTFLLDIFSKIKEIKKDTVLLLVGDGELFESMVQKINLLELEDSVILVGSTDRPELFYSIMDVVLLPSHFEGLSLAAIESQVSGVPVIVSEAVPFEVNISNKCYFLSLNDSVKDWANKALEVARSEVTLSKNSEKFDIKKQAPNLQKWYLYKQNEFSSNLLNGGD